MSTPNLLDSGLRFQFGANWQHFLSKLSDQRIDDAQFSLKNMLCITDMSGQRFLDIGSGSGLFSLAARKLGVIVHSFDFDSNSVACTQELKRRYFPNDPLWVIEEGSVLDDSYLQTLGQFDIVYSWGVLHHTGAMWLGIENAINRLKPGGLIFIALYNNQGWKSHFWWFIKYFYNKFPKLLQIPFVSIIMFIIRIIVIFKYTLKLKLAIAIRIFETRTDRGMSKKYDEIDWVGGFPFEFVSFDMLVAYFTVHGFTLINSIRNDGLGCNQFVFQDSKCVD